jgi:hypothetical protein
VPDLRFQQGEAKQGVASLGSVYLFGIRIRYFKTLPLPKHPKAEASATSQQKRSQRLCWAEQEERGGERKDEAWQRGTRRGKQSQAPR